MNVGRYLMGTRDNLWRIQILCVLLVSFFFGGYIAQKLHHKLGKYQLLLSAGISFFIGFSYILYLRISQYHLTISQAIFGIPQSSDPLRESIETNLDSELKSVYSYEYSAVDDDYRLTIEQARQLHCKTTGELIDSDTNEEHVQTLLGAIHEDTYESAEEERMRLDRHYYYFYQLLIF